MNGGLTQSPSYAFGIGGRFALLTYASKLATFVMQSAPPTSLEGRLCPLLYSVRTF
jgi:hypothetical protein